MMTPSKNPNKLSSMVTSALLRNKPDLRPSTSAASTSRGAGNIKSGTLPVAVLTNQLISKTRASARGGTINIARCVAIGVVRERLMPGDSFLLSSGAVPCNSNDSFFVVVVTLIDFPRSNLY